MRPLRNKFQIRLLRWPLAMASGFIIINVLLFGILYWQTSVFMDARFDEVITTESAMLAAATDEARSDALATRAQYDPHKSKLGGVFAADGKGRIGNIVALPPALSIDGPAQEAHLVRADKEGQRNLRVRAIARRLQNGDVLVIGRNVDEMVEIEEITIRSLAIGTFTNLALAVSACLILGLRMSRRVDAVTRMATHIVSGDLRRRLPIQAHNDDFGALARVINGMLDQIERLVSEISGVGDDIAHELRTPLTRVRAILERGRENGTRLEDLQCTVDRAIGGLDRALLIITALLRIAEIEHGRRLEAFGEVHLSSIVHEVAEFYAPIAEDRGLSMRVSAENVAPVRGDRDLLFEAVANLVDNAIKFTPSGGLVTLRLFTVGDKPVVRVSDTGSGISEAERDAVTRRFYRSDKSRHAPGFGLGLTLVSAIAKLHGFRLTIGGSSGCVVEMSSSDRT
ncbi:MAG TPA: HAMP domain-containing sensor histidine kinase [Dongiaceae bacterium]|nr:HAMP domain-containing sensor histidine kinase [Dongiaceae bacterium]